MKKIILMLLCLPMLSNATSLIMRPTAAGWYATNWNGTYADVDDVTSDGDGTYISTRLFSTDYCIFEFGSSGLTGSETISNVTLYVTVKTSGGSPDINIVGSDASDFTMYDYGKAITSSYTTVSESFATNPHTGVAWTKASLEDFDWGVNSYTESGEVRVTQIYIDVTYTSGGGGSTSFPTKLLLQGTGK